MKARMYHTPALHLEGLGGFHDLEAVSHTEGVVLRLFRTGDPVAGEYWNALLRIHADDWDQLIRSACSSPSGTLDAHLSHMRHLNRGGQP